MALLLLDLDNTVADREAAFCHWLDVSLATWAPGDPDARQVCIALDEDGFRPRSEFFADLRSHFNLSTPIEQLLTDYRRVTLEGFPPMDDNVKARLAAMRGAGWKIAVVTNGEAVVQEATAERVGVAPLLDACIISGAVGIRKPDPRIFALAADACEETLTDAWMIGDGDVDVVGAIQAGVRMVWLARSRTWRRIDIAPRYVADSLADALDHVLQESGPTL